MNKIVSFPEVSSIVLRYMKRGYYQKDYINDLFSWGIENGKILEDDLVLTTSNQWLNGKRPITGYISRLYSCEDGVQHLEESINKRLITHISDFNAALDKIRQLVQGDISIHPNTKKEIISQEDSRFLAVVIQFAINRQLEKTRQDKLFDVTDIFLGVNVPRATDAFIGRNKELKYIHEELENNGQLFLSGIAGIGKSELARQYASVYQNEYDNILYLTYTKDIENTVRSMVLKGENNEAGEQVLFESHYRILQSLDDRSLVIVDNVDQPPDKDSLLRKFINNKFKVLLTTKLNIQAVPLTEIKELDSKNNLLKLFRHYYKYSQKEEDVIKDIIDEVCYHTLTIELAARTLAAGSMEPKELLYELVSRGLKISSRDKVTITKDEIDTTEVMYRHLQTLFKISRLSTDQKYILMNFSLMPLSGVNKNKFSSWLELPDNNILNDLITLGWIKEDLSNRRLYMQPLACKIICEETRPDSKRCSVILNNINGICLRHGIDVEDYRNFFDCIMSITEKIIVTDAVVWMRFLQDAFCYMEKYSEYKGMCYILQKLNNIMQKTDKSTVMDVALYLNYQAQLYSLNREHDKAIKTIGKAERLLPPINLENALFHSNIYNNFGLYHMKKRDFSKAEQYIEKSLKIFHDYGGLPMHDLIAQVYNYSALLLKKNKQAETNRALGYLKDMLTLIEGNIGKDSSDYGVALEQLGLAFLQSGELQKAINNFGQARTLYEKYRGEGHPDTKRLNSLYCQCLTISEKRKSIANKKKAGE